ncbi:MAG: Ppx/GppA phosphatase family protein [Elusimicrobiota bacterium]
MSIRVGIIDLGTNSVRFDVYQIGPGLRTRRLHREKLPVRLGSGVFLNGRLDPAAVRRTLQAFDSFKRTADEFRAGRVAAFGTSALRAASDGRALARAVRRRTGIELKIISGEEEARLIARGVLANKKKAKGRFALVDIGGGSTEISLCRRRKLLHAASFPLGSTRLQETFLKGVPPRPASGDHPLDALRVHIRNVLRPFLKSKEWPGAARVVGSGGTIRALTELHPDEGGGKKTLAFARLRKIVKELSRLTPAQLKRVPGMEASRAETILAGAVLLEEVMRALGAEKVSATSFSLREGILEKELASVRRRETASQGFDLEDAARKARVLGVDEGRVRATLGLGSRLFRKLRRLHGLAPEWEKFLLAAAVLGPAGKNVSRAGHEEHACYIARHADFPLVAEWESEFIAQLCLWNGAEHPSENSLARLGGGERRRAFLKLLALLRLLDALDRPRGFTVSLRSASVRKDGVTLRIAGHHGDTALEILRVERKKALFEKVFRRPLSVVNARR